MRLTVRAVGMAEDEDDEVLEAGFSENEDGSGIAVFFQRDLFAEDPWEAPAEETPETSQAPEADLFNNSYCVTTGAGATAYGGVLSIDLSQSPAQFRLSPRAASTLGLSETLEITFDVPEEDWERFRRGLRRVVTWGVPSQVPEVRGL
ncbi:hypothetical protein [Streptomyces sp. NPDC059009]|uniref:hypothetical protein n=1 Tax=Streptomyces sp. NPDC059009 TaxID=3346694 RepID=UPI0036981AD6